MRSFWLLVLAFVVFFVLGFVTEMLPLAGPVANVKTRAVAVSRLDADTLRRAITLYPGRKDDRTICGEADENGIFDAETVLPFDAGDFDGMCGGPDDDEADDVEGLDPQVLKDLANGIIRTCTKAMVFESTADHHEVFCMGGADEVIAARYQFKPLKSGGTRVIYEESGAEMPLAMRLSFWLQDYTADYLTEEIDRAEGRAPRANRAFPHRQLVVDIARIMVPWLNRQGLQPPSGGAA